MVRRVWIVKLRAKLPPAQLSKLIAQRYKLIAQRFAQFAQAADSFKNRITLVGPHAFDKAGYS